MGTCILSPYIIIIACIYKTCTEEIYAVTVDYIVETIDLCLGLEFSVRSCDSQPRKLAPIVSIWMSDF